MNKEKLIEALETALAVLTQPTVTFTPPKREPLSDDEIDVWCQYNNIRALEKLRFQQGVIFAEKKHGIGDKL